MVHTTGERSSSAGEAGAQIQQNWLNTAGQCVAGSAPGQAARIGGL